MARVIWKFPINVTKVTAIEIPEAAQIRLAALDPASGAPAIWVELNPEAPRRERLFRVYGTGHPIDGDGGYPYDIHVGSVIDRTFVWHIFEQRF